MRRIALLLAAIPSLAAAQGGRGSGPLQTATQLDVAGKTAEARALIQGVIDTSSQPAGKAAAQRAMAMSYGFDGDCANTVKYEVMVMEYWKTREAAEPQNAFYQQGEMANEAARICIDVGALDVAEKLYKQGYELGIKEPLPATHPRSLWEYRTAHAFGRLAARRGNRAEAVKQVAIARRILDADSTMRVAQERFYSYLVGYVALYTGDLAGAERELVKTVEMQGNANDPFMRYLLGLTYEKLGRTADAKAAYEKAWSLATAHNPPAAFVRQALRKQGMQ